MNNDLIYVYCISDKPLVPGQVTVTTGLKAVPFSNLYIIVKDVPYSEFSEENLKRNLSEIHWLESMAVEHVNVINGIMRHSTVVPFKFGTIFNNEENLLKFFTDYSDSIEENFIHLRGREEWAVKIYCDRRKLSEQIDDLSVDAAKMEEQIMASSPGKAYLLKRKKTEFVNSEMDRLINDYGQSYFDSFKNLSVSSRLNNILPVEVTGRADSMILNAAFLVNKEQVFGLRSTISSLIKKDGHSGFSIEATGPWPPFSFVTVKEKSDAR